MDKGDFFVITIYIYIYIYIHIHVFRPSQHSSVWHIAEVEKIIFLIFKQQQKNPKNLVIAVIIKIF